MKKLNKILLGAALLAAGSFVSAQATLHGEVDFTTFAIEQNFDKAGDGDLNHTKPYASFSEDSSTTIDLNLRAANFEFNFGIKLNSGLGDEGDGDYWDATKDNVGTPFYQGNMKIAFFTEQLLVYTGRFEDFSAGYITTGSVLDDQITPYFASSSEGQYLTAIEWKPYIYPLQGLKLFAGLPILPNAGNGVNPDKVSNQWKNLWKKAKLAASYQLPESDIVFTAGWRPGTYYSGVPAYGSDFTTNYYSDVFFQANLPSLVEYMPMTITADFRYKDSNYLGSDGVTVDHTAIAAALAYSTELNFIEAFPMQAEIRGFYADDDFLKSDEKMAAAVLGLAGEYAFDGTQWSCGFILRGTYAQDARGTAFADGAVDSDSFDVLELGEISCASMDGLAGSATKYICGYLNPYAQFNLSNGYLRMGVELEYTCFSGNQTNMSFDYRVPVGLYFMF